MANYSPEHKAVLDQMFADHPDLRPGKMFGFPAYYVGRKLSICLYEQGVGVKLPPQTSLRLLEQDPNVQPFQPYGKAKMREWVQINLTDSQEYQNYRSLFEESIDYLRSQSSAK